MGGIGNGINSSSSMALLSGYEKNRDDYIAYFEVGAGLGAIVGPLFGSLMYFFFGFRGPFFGLGILYIMAICIFLKRR